MSEIQTHPVPDNDDRSAKGMDGFVETQKASEARRAEQASYIRALNTMPSNQRAGIIFDAAVTLVRALGITAEDIFAAVDAKNPTPEQKAIAEAFSTESASILKTIAGSQWDSHIKQIQDLRTLDVIGTHGEEMYQEALKSTSSELNIDVEALQELVESGDLFASSERLSFAAFPIRERADALATLYKTSSELEEIARLHAVDFDLESTDAVVKSVPVSAEQKLQWQQLKAFDLPKSGRIKVIPILGGEGLSMSGEIDHIQKSLAAAKGHATVQIADPIDNNMLVKQEILAKIESEYSKDDADTIIFYASTHGFTRSFDTPQVPELRLGLTTKGSANDVFHIQNEKATDTVSARASAGEYRQQAEQMVRDFLEKEPSFFQGKDGKPIVHKLGEMIRIGDEDLRVIEDIADPLQLITRLSTHLQYIDLEKGSVSTDDLCQLQKVMRQKYPRKEVIYILDNCFSGSATNDQLANLDGTRAILSASSEDEPAVQNSKTDRGHFMEELFSNLELGYTLGESFVRADIKLNFIHKPRLKPSPEKEWQNPAASVREKDGHILKISSIGHRDSTDRLV